MKPNKIFLADDGIRCFVAPDRSKYIPDYDNGEKYNKAWLILTIAVGIASREECDDDF